MLDLIRSRSTRIEGGIGGGVQKDKFLKSIFLAVSGPNAPRCLSPDGAAVAESFAVPRIRSFQARVARLLNPLKICDPAKREAEFACTPRRYADIESGLASLPR